MLVELLRDPALDRFGVGWQDSENAIVGRFWRTMGLRSYSITIKMPLPDGLTIIVPTLNEAENIQPLLTRIFRQDLGAVTIQVLFVDDGSIDGTCDCIRNLAKTQLAVSLLQRQQPTGGLAGAVLDGALATSNRWILVMDADLSHPPEAIGSLVAPLLDRSQDMVIGSRYTLGGRTPGWPWWRRLGSRMACLLAWPLTRLHDPLSGFFATERETLIQCKGRAVGFKIALELVVNAAREFRVKEIPIVFRDRERGVSKMRFVILFTYLLRLVILSLQCAWRDPISTRQCGRSLRTPR